MQVGAESDAEWFPNTTGMPHCIWPHGLPRLALGSQASQFNHLHLDGRSSPSVNEIHYWEGTSADHVNML